MSDGVSKSWFCTFNNPHEYGYEGEPHEVVDKIISDWINDNPTRTCAVTYCISEDGLKHCHAVLEDTKAMRFSVVKKVFPSMNIQPTKGNKEQAEDYINKKGKFQEKGEVILYSNRHGEIKANQGQRRDLEIIEDLINLGKTPTEIMDQSFSYRKYERMIKSAYYSKRKKETASVRDLKCVWYVGESGSGKSYERIKMIEKHGEDSIYLLTDYENGGLDEYNGEPILFMDEFRGNIKYSTLLIMLDKYKSQIHARYSNITALWNEVHITSVIPPEKLYANMVNEHRELDTLEQLKRRIDYIVYCWKDEMGRFKKFEMPMENYKNYEDLKQKAIDYEDENNGSFNKIIDENEIPF